MLQTKPVPQDLTCYQLLNNFQLFFWILRKIAANPWMSFKCLLRYHFLNNWHNLNPWCRTSLSDSCATVGGAGPRSQESNPPDPQAPIDYELTTSWPKIIWIKRLYTYIMCIYIYIHIHFEEKQWLNSGSLSPWVFIAEGFEYWQKAPANSLDHDLLSLGHSIGDKLDNSCHGRCDRLWYMLFKSK